MPPAAQDGFPVRLAALVRRLLLAVVLPGLVRLADGAALRGSMRGSVFMQVETATSGKVTLDTSEELGRLKESELLLDVADDPSSGILEVAEDSGEQAEAAQAAALGAGARSSSDPHAAQLKRIGRLVDTDRDARISQEELQNFAHRLKDRQRHEHTLTAMRAVDADGSSNVDLAELRAFRNDASPELLDHQARRFGAADADRNGRLDFAEFHAFVHPELSESVLAVEVERQMSVLDKDGDGHISFEEFEQEGEAHGQDFSREAALEDFRLHDRNADGHLSAHEFGRLLAGHDLLQESARKAMEAGDGDGDGHIHVDDELPARLHDLLESEFIEDYFFHEDAERHGGRTEL
mmetsp:Transcript_102686/g.306716  ORF Transcript_102686/g.306716 Transcript_102686/m.306716 type:complete len:351 (-) Transcript_102686:88-1140(-)